MLILIMTILPSTTKTNMRKRMKKKTIMLMKKVKMEKEGKCLKI